MLDDEGNELLLPKTEQIPGDFYRKAKLHVRLLPEWTTETIILKSF